MKPLREAWCCQIELTNLCGHSCLYCSRLNRHLRPDQRFSMDEAQLQKAFDALATWPGKIGIIGGEPTLHPAFEKMCRIIQSRKSGRWVGLWTSGGKRYESFKKLITETFDWVAYNDHKDTTLKHQRLTVASQDAVPDAEYRQYLIDNCWVQRIWCPTISPRGVYFCEVAYALDLLFDGQRGWDVEPDWWRRLPETWTQQKELCQLCGMAVPMERDCVTSAREHVSPSMLEVMKSHQCRSIGEDKVELDAAQYSREVLEALAPTWMPGNYKPGTDPGGLL